MEIVTSGRTYRVRDSARVALHLASLCVVCLYGRGREQIGSNQTIVVVVVVVVVVLLLLSQVKFDDESELMMWCKALNQVLAH